MPTGGTGYADMTVPPRLGRVWYAVAVSAAIFLLLPAAASANRILELVTVRPHLECSVAGVPCDVYLVGATRDGSGAVILTGDAMVPWDVNQTSDLYLRRNGVSTLLTSDGLHAPPTIHFAGISDDGSHVFFWSEGPVTPDDTGLFPSLIIVCAAREIDPWRRRWMANSLDTAHAAKSPRSV
jgi:hypothetical protein